VHLQFAAVRLGQTVELIAIFQLRFGCGRTILLQE
jgi:hypothetical protein